jgi:hypothetical protein
LIATDDDRFWIPFLYSSTFLHARPNFKIGSASFRTHLPRIDTETHPREEDIRNVMEIRTSLHPSRRSLDGENKTNVSFRNQPIPDCTCESRSSLRDSSEVHSVMM